MTFLSANADHGSRARLHRHGFYRQLFVLTVVQMMIMALPWGLHRLGSLATGMMMLLLLAQLGRRRFAERRLGFWPTWLYRLLGGSALAVLVRWLLSTANVRWLGLLLLMLVGSFVFWSLRRLLVLLREEDTISTSVLAGAISGYLMLGIAGGLVLSVLETLQPGSFVDLIASNSSLDLVKGPLNKHLNDQINMQSWNVDFSRINYFAFVSVTTVGYGDIVPVRRLAQVACIALSIAGPLYIAVVMGLLISRYTVQTQQEEDAEQISGSDGDDERH